MAGIPLVGATGIGSQPIPGLSPSGPVEAGVPIAPSTVETPRRFEGVTLSPEQLAGAARAAGEALRTLAEAGITGGEALTALVHEWAKYSDYLPPIDAATYEASLAETARQLGVEVPSVQVDAGRHLLYLAEQVATLSGQEAPAGKQWAVDFLLAVGRAPGGMELLRASVVELRPFAGTYGPIRNDRALERLVERTGVLLPDQDLSEVWGKLSGHLAAQGFSAPAEVRDFLATVCRHLATRTVDLDLVEARQRSGPIEGLLAKWAQVAGVEPPTLVRTTVPDDPPHALYAEAAFFDAGLELTDGLRAFLAAVEQTHVEALETAMDQVGAGASPHFVLRQLVTQTGHPLEPLPRLLANDERAARPPLPALPPRWYGSGGAKLEAKIRVEGFLITPEAHQYLRQLQSSHPDLLSRVSWGFTETYHDPETALRVTASSVGALAPPPIPADLRGRATFLASRISQYLQQLTPDQVAYVQRVGSTPEGLVVIDKLLFDRYMGVPIRDLIRELERRSGVRQRSGLGWLAF